MILSKCFLPRILKAVEIIQMKKQKKRTDELSSIVHKKKATRKGSNNSSSRNDKTDNRQTNKQSSKQANK